MSNLYIYIYDINFLLGNWWRKIVDLHTDLDDEWSYQGGRKQFLARFKGILNHGREMCIFIERGGAPQLDNRV